MNTSVLNCFIFGNLSLESPTEPLSLRKDICTPIFYRYQELLWISTETLLQLKQNSIFIEHQSQFRLFIKEDTVISVTLIWPTSSPPSALGTMSATSQTRSGAEPSRLSSSCSAWKPSNVERFISMMVKYIEQCRTDARLCH